MKSSSDGYYASARARCRTLYFSAVSMTERSSGSASA